MTTAEVSPTIFVTFLPEPRVDGGGTLPRGDRRCHTLLVVVGEIVSTPVKSTKVEAAPRLIDGQSMNHGTWGSASSAVTFSGHSVLNVRAR